MNAMYQINNYTNNDDVKLLDSLGPFTVIEYQKDLSVMPGSGGISRARGTGVERPFPQNCGTGQ